MRDKKEYLINEEELNNVSGGRRVDFVDVSLVDFSEGDVNVNASRVVICPHCGTSLSND